jgi:hypothetical protein
MPKVGGWERVKRGLNSEKPCRSPREIFLWSEQTSPFMALKKLFEGLIFFLFWSHHYAIMRLLASPFGLAIKFDHFLFNSSGIEIDLEIDRGYSA